MSTYRQRIARVANSGDEEPGARDVQARICGGLGWATTQVYPAWISLTLDFRKDALTSRQEARERRIVTTVKPFAGTLRVTNPARKSRASSRKRVLHDGGQPPL